MIGQVVSHYRIEEKLGEGGMGVVYRAEDLRLQRPVALKFLPPHLVADDRAKERFYQEARAASALDHPNICSIYEIDEADDGQVFIAMAYYAGETLAEKLKRGPLAILDAVEVTRQVAHGLSRAHDRGVIHRDIKPANLRATEDGIWKILDFGIAKLAGANRLTRTGHAVGTVGYGSPEQLTSDEASPQADVWSLGAVLYEMLTGQLPFKGATPVAALYHVLHEQPKAIRTIRHEVPLALDRVVVRALAKDRRARYADMIELLADLGSLGGVAPEVQFPDDLVGESNDIPDGREVTLPPFLTPDSEPSNETLLPPFVGREKETEVLEAWLRGALAGQGRVGFITGDAGSGKTALAQELCRRAAESDDRLIVAIGNCDAHTGPGDPHHPFREILRLLTGDVEAQWAGGSLSADHATRLWSFLPSAVQALMESGPGLVGSFIQGGLLSRADVHPALKDNQRNALRELVDHRGGGVQQADVVDQFIRVLRSLARERPLLLVVDDLQWADAGSVAVLFQLGRRLVGSRILVIGLYRPSEVALGRDGQRHPLEPVINELSAQFGEVLIEIGATGDRRFVDALVDAEPNRLETGFRDSLYSQTQGHALFTVELLRTMREQGSLVRNEDGDWVETPGLRWDRLPVRVDAVIKERMARLPAELRRLLTIASVEGAEFTLEATARIQGVEVRDLVVPVSLELERRHRLVNSEGLHRVNGTRLSVYRFRHVLFQRYLYEQLTEVERVHLHEQVGEALEQLYGDRTDQIALRLARHFQAAGTTEKTVAYLEMAGNQARSIGCVLEAVGHFKGALDALRALPPALERDHQELEIQLELVNALHATALPGQAEAASRAYELAQRAGSKHQVFWALHSMYWTFAHYAPDNRLGQKLAEEALSLAREVGDKSLVGHGLDTAGRNAFLRGDHLNALAYYEELESFYAPEEHRNERFSAIFDVGCAIPGTMGLILWCVGYPDQALVRGEEAVARARDLRSPSTHLLMQMYVVYTHMWRGEFQEARRVCEALRKRADELGLGAYYDFMDIHSGWCAAQQGEVAEGIQSIQRGLKAWHAIGWKVWASWGSALLAQALLMDGRAEEGLKVLNEAHAATEGSDELCHEAEIHRTLGELYLGLTETKVAEAEAAFRHAIQVARSQEARSYELRARISLARLLREQGRSAEARDSLAEAFGWFTEGFGTADLKEAKALLAELGTA
jgi:predicted ATPase